LGALVAGKVIAKTGFIATANHFLNKCGVIFVVEIAAFLKQIFTRKKA